MKLFYKTYDIHIHAPEGAIPKDGPSAGVTIATALLSVLTGMKVKRDVCMTGEITLRGRVLPIGGLKEKTMAAFKSGMRTVIIPSRNKPDLEKIDPTVKNTLKFVFADDFSTVVENALVFDEGKINHKNISSVITSEKTINQKSVTI